MRGLSICLLATMTGVLLAGAVQAEAPTTARDNERANALLKQMTTEEKIGQLNQPFYFKLPIPGAKTDSVSYEDHVRHEEIGSFLFLTDPKEINRPAEDRADRDAAACSNLVLGSM